MRAPSWSSLASGRGCPRPTASAPISPTRPRVGRKDGERNCVSNIRRGGLSAEEAAYKINWLLREAFRRSLTGVALKDESDFLLDGSSCRARARQAVAILSAGVTTRPRWPA